MAPTIDALAADLVGRAKVVTVDVDAEPELAGQYGVNAMPTLLVIDKGRVVEQRLGAAPRSVIEAMLLPHLPAVVVA
jgi:thioredoxin-like negative regulator of GroEL